MKTTIDIDDELLIEAKKYNGLDELSAIVNAALTALIEREVARRLTLLGGSDPTAEAAPRRRPT